MKFTFSSARVFGAIALALLLQAWVTLFLWLQLFWPFSMDGAIAMMLSTTLLGSPNPR